MAFNSDAYLQNQITKQYVEPPHSSEQVDLYGEPFDMDEALMKRITASDIAGLQKMVKEEMATYEDIAKAFYNQVLLHHDSRAVITLNQAVISEARKLDYLERHDPLYGIPVLVKDNIATTEMPTTGGAVYLKDFMPKQDAAIIKRLKAKGALILGKTNLSEWANFMTTKSANGYSAVGGQAKNPYGSFDVGGSSAGSGVAVAKRMSPVAIGTETAGSVIYPASQNGIVGLKPTLTTVPQEGIIPVAKSHDTAGPMANTVRDCYYLLAGMETLDGLLADRRLPLSKYTFGFLEDEALKDVYRGEDEAVLADFRQRMAKTGAGVQGITVAPEAHRLNIVDVLKYEFNEGVKAFFKESSQPATLKDVVAFNLEDEKNRSPHGQDLLVESSTQTFTASEIEEQVAHNQAVAKAALDEAFQHVDVLVTISNYATTLYATSGYPALTLPGYKRETGEPVGITLIGKAKSDMDLLHVGELIEEEVLRFS
ncbi:amidase family protein [Salisediminibacterium beveridgei]|uniref:Glutamyl-tRNA(Gln) amidotransferase subunit A 2 n=1 Tax=Salisediminibacterium beveridgei TaxID=632773 RepID=A0A1D7QWW5_9BACI|nr:amidase family protein [Salisediminibacterium beveridgei]AOM83514.1 Glutamyl-tRNA(Gln) amidotransferase subunit A 2 [Salisediminibacterium beveridgei]